MFRMGIRRLALGCALLAVTAFAGTAAGGRAAWPKPDARDKALLARVLHGMRTDLKTVRLTRLEAEWHRGRTPGTLELQTTTAVRRTDHVRSIRADWETLLIAHGYDERCKSVADHCLGIAIGPKGGGGAGVSHARSPFWSRRALAGSIRRQFAAHGLKVMSIAFEHPNGFASIITVSSSHINGARAAENNAWVAAMPALRHSEGTFVVMYGPHGRLLLVSAGSGNDGVGWCAPVLKCPAA